MLMMAFKITHPPAGGNPIIVMIGGVSFQFLIFPVMVGAIAIIIGGIIYNRLILKKNTLRLGNNCLFYNKRSAKSYNLI